MRPGGSADKLGNHYESMWTVWHLLQVLAGTVDSITVEELGAPGKGAEFTLRRRGDVQVHQTKRQLTGSKSWSLADLHRKEVLTCARDHVSANREYHFVSGTPATELDELSELARHSPDVSGFLGSLGATRQPRFDDLCRKLDRGPEQAWHTLRGIWVHRMGEHDIRTCNSALAQLLLTGTSAATASAALADLVLQNLSVVLDHTAIVDRLPEYGLALSARLGSASLVASVRERTRCWQDSIARELLDPPIQRSDPGAIAEAVRGNQRCLFVTGEGGAGKSWVLHAVAEEFLSAEWPVLAFRLDRIEPCSTTTELGARLDLPLSPAPALAAAAQGRPCLLVIDQLDAVSKVSGRLPHVFDVVANLVRETRAFPNMRVVLGCRTFDVDNDNRILTLLTHEEAGRHPVPLLTDEQVHAAVTAMGLDHGKLTQRQLALLCSPVRLKVLAQLASRDDPFAFNTEKDLFDRYWQHKIADCQLRRGGQVRFAEVISTLAKQLSRRQQLWASESVLDENDLLIDANILVSEHVLVRDGTKLAFFHEAFFDYAFARRWINLNQRLTDFLHDGEQELFRRAQVRQILTHLRADDPARSRAEVATLLGHPGIRFHLKEVVLAWLATLPSLTAADWTVIQRYYLQDDPLGIRMRRMLRTQVWFDLLDELGLVTSWLGDPERAAQDRAIELLQGSIRQRPTRIAQILAPHAGTHDRYVTWLRWLGRFADLSASRELFDLVLTSVRRGEQNTLPEQWLVSLHGLGRARPEWAMDLLSAYLVDRPDALVVNSYGRVDLLCSDDYHLIRFVSDVAQGAPREFCEVLVPYLLDVMATTACADSKFPINCHHFTGRDFPQYHELDSVLLAQAASALGRFASTDPVLAMPLLEQLSTSPYEDAQWLLYEALAAVPEQLSAYAVNMLVDRPGGFSATNSARTTLRLVEAIGQVAASDVLTRLETAILAYSPNWESRTQRGRATYVLLRMLPESRLSTAGSRRLSELRRRFGQVVIAEPPAMELRPVEPPISREAAARMRDENWLQAMAKYHSEEDLPADFHGGAAQLAMILQAEAQNDPARFAGLALKMSGDLHPAYLDAILLGLGHSTALVDTDLLCEAVAHLASLSADGHNRWTGWAIRRYIMDDLPNSMIELLLAHARHARDPQSETWTAVSTSNTDDPANDPWQKGLNTCRGSAAEALGNILVHDSDGRRTALIAPHLAELSRDASVAVRSCAAHLVAAALRHARASALGAFASLIDCDDRLLATHPVLNLLIHIDDPAVVVPVIQRMLDSAQAIVRKAGGTLAGHYALRFTMADLLTAVRESEDPATRHGAADACAGRIRHTTNTTWASAALAQYFEDPDTGVRRAAAITAMVLRGERLADHRPVLIALINSPALLEAASQLLITLEQAPDRVDDLIIRCAQRFIELHGADAADIATSAAADTPQLGNLLLRAYAQAEEPSSRAAVLDLFDRLLELDSYGIGDLVDQAQR